MMARLSIISLFALGLLFLGSVYGRTGVGAGEQEWGYVTVRPDAHMFWWLYFTTDNKVISYYEKPLVIWLQGGPGASSTGYGNFEELGPYDVNLKPRNYTWVKDYNVLFIDNPVGTGFSYAANTKAFATTNAQIAADLLAVMRGFYKKLPQFRKVPVYITSESYGGKMAAEFALLWYKVEKSGAIDSNLRGVGLGDSWISPIDSVLTWAPFLLQTGMVDTNGFKEIERAANQTKVAVQTGQWDLATSLWGSAENVILRVTKNIDFYNILTKVPSGYAKFNTRNLRSLAQAMVKRNERMDDASLERLMNNKVRDSLNLNVTWGAQSQTVFKILYGDFMKPVVRVVERLLDETDLKVFVYTGQLDLIVDTPGTWLWVENMNWSYAKNWQASPRNALTVNNIVEGYHKTYRNFSFYWINRAGHMVPADNPAATAQLLKDLIGK